MSSAIGKRPADELPADLEEKVAAAQGVIAGLERQLFDLTELVGKKSAEEAALSARIEEARASLGRTVAEQEGRVAEIAAREEKVTQKESALDVYANALKEKEERINKYLAIFDNMKKAIGG